MENLNLNPAADMRGSESAKAKYRGTRAPEREGVYPLADGRYSRFLGGLWRAPHVEIQKAATETRVDAFASPMFRTKPHHWWLDTDVSGQECVPNRGTFRVIGAHPNGNFFDIEVAAVDAVRAFGVAADLLAEADADGETEFFVAIPVGVAYEMPGHSIVTLETVCDPEQAGVFYPAPEEAA